MPSNTLNYNQVSAVMNEAYKLGTGQESTATFNGGDVVSVAQKLLTTGYDNFIGSISQVLARTIFSIRPYTRKFAGLQVDNQRFGAITRKISPINKMMVNDQGLPLTDGQSVDQYRISKHNALQLNFYGKNGYEYRDTRPDWQIDAAVRDATELAQYITMMTVDAQNTIEKYHEETARFTIGNMITGVMASRTNDVIHLLTEYNTDTGAGLTNETVYLPENYPAFMKWVYARIAQISELMTEYSINYHTNLTDGVIMRHTPKRMQKVYLYSKLMYDATARVLADTYHDTFLTFGDVEPVNFWQDIDNPTSLKMTPTVLNANGNLSATQAIDTSKVVGLIMDEEAAGYSIFNYRVRTAYNADGEYTNIFYKFTDRYWNDFTENAVVLCMD